MAGRWARRIAIFVVVLALAWPAIGGFVLWRVASDILTVGPLAEALGELPPPEGPLELGYRGDPGEAFGLPFETVEIDTPLGPAPAWYVPGERATGAVYVHGIAGTASRARGRTGTGHCRSCRRRDTRCCSSPIATIRARPPIRPGPAPSA